MKLPKRFALSTLLLLMLMVAAVFGYAQWRRQWLLSEVKALNMNGGVLAPLQFTDSKWWPHVSGEAIVVLQRNDDGTFIVDKEAVGVPAAEGFYEAMTDRLHAIGVRKVFYAVMVERGYTRYRVMFRLRGIDDLRNDFADIERRNEIMLFH